MLEDILSNSRKTSNMRSPKTGNYMELDFYIPDLHLAFEYQVYLFHLLLPSLVLPSLLLSSFFFC